MKIAIVCDWLTGIGGAERVVLELHKLYPDAPIFTSQYDPGKIDWFRDADVRTGWLQHFPTALKKFLPPLRAWYFSHLKLKGYDLVISSSGAEAKGIRVPKGTKHICYCHSPTQYYWVRYDEYIRNPGFGFLNPVARLGLRLLVGPMKRWDYRAAQGPDHMVANSRYTKANIKKFYGREATVVYPPVDTGRFAPRQPVERGGFVVAGRQTPYKNQHLAVAACTELKLPLTVVGDGPDHKRLVEMAGPSITFKTGVPDKDMPGYFQSAAGFIFPNTDDFGIIAVEAMAAGAPVIALKHGGALDTVVDGKSGIFFDKPNKAALMNALSHFEPRRFDNAAIARWAETFSDAKFATSVRRFIDEVLQSNTERNH